MRSDMRHTKEEPLTPMELAERWLARLAIRTVIATRKQGNATSSDASPAPTTPAEPRDQSGG